MYKLLTIIVPIYNAEEYLIKCIDSIVNQTYTNLEIILVNDGSTDGSGRIIEEYAARDNRILVIHKENAGIGSAYHVAFEKMTGDYVSFVDSDDYVALNAYEELMTAVNKEKPDMVHFGVRVFNEKREELINTSFKTLDKIIIGNDEILKAHFELLKHPALARLFKRELFKNITIFDQNIGIDEMLTPQLLLHCNKAVYTSRPYYYVLARHNSVCREVYNDKKINETIKVNRFICAFLENNRPQYASFIHLKYLSILLSFYHQSFGDKTLMKEETQMAVVNDAKVYFKKVRASELYEKEAFRFRATTLIIIYYPVVYKLIYKTIKRLRIWAS